MISNLIKSKNFQPAYLENSTPAWIGHLPFAYWLVLQQKPRVLVELGTHYGNSYFTFCQAAVACGLPTRCFAVDCWRGDAQAGSYEDDVYGTVDAFNAARYAGFSTLLRMTFDEALPNFADRSIDLLHVDGLHTYDAVRHDFQTWRPKLSDRAIVLFHDIAVKGEGFGVARFWNELKATHPASVEFDHNYGLGVLWLGCDPAVKPPGWLVRNSWSQVFIRRVFANRGIKLAVQHKTKKHLE